MTDYTELKRLAEASKSSGAELSDLHIDTERMYTAEYSLVRLYEIATPSVVLTLIAENEQLKNDHANMVLRNKVLRDRPDLAVDRVGCHDQVIALQAERRQLRAEVAGLKTGYEAYERVNAELKAEVEALRKDAARYQWLREASSGYIEVVEWIGPHATGMIGEDLDALLDAAMGKGEQS